MKIRKRKCVLPSCSVIIATSNRKNELLRCLKSIEEQTVSPDEVIVVDSSDNPEELHSLCTFHNGILMKYIYTSDRSLTRQRNTGVNNSKGEIVFFFDDDIELDEMLTNYYLLLGQSLTTTILPKKEGKKNGQGD